MSFTRADYQRIYDLGAELRQLGQGSRAGGMARVRRVGVELMIMAEDVIGQLAPRPAANLLPAATRQE